MRNLPVAGVGGQSRGLDRISDPDVHTAQWEQLVGQWWVWTLTCYLNPGRTAGQSQSCTATAASQINSTWRRRGRTRWARSAQFCISETALLVIKECRRKLFFTTRRRLSSRSRNHFFLITTRGHNHRILGKGEVMEWVLPNCLHFPPYTSPDIS